MASYVRKLFCWPHSNLDWGDLNSFIGFIALMETLLFIPGSVTLISSEFNSMDSLCWYFLVSLVALDSVQEILGMHLVSWVSLWRDIKGQENQNVFFLWLGFLIMTSYMVLTAYLYMSVASESYKFSIFLWKDTAWTARYSQDRKYSSREFSIMLSRKKI